ncbi:hypothetical protein COU19_03140 [Candidatus Kaiserbacteria bacterium CG10_big_fil_rev_8_21_14_0_10_56_12]|uniref:Type 4a pilus biogenesis protein PilO n=1 Tax=Candidatus Kaiserbacteria bacterium CG10_big_fil_rev_8_21_14_0_10_56_12 TaxID=1974611 RepID=A0A2H0UAV0_9BACT|nr:MAG: hypothetical protein COU19_03140 [Candidatus Kaiserbacteria bacterium CG10_big_fil_rev_8_21_14_0_10_56_12]
MNNRLTPILALVIAGALYFAYVSPTWSGRIADTKTAIASSDAALVAAHDYKDKQNKLAEERDALDPADLARLNALLPDSVDNVGLILSLNALADRSGLTLSNIDVSSNANSAQENSGGLLNASPTNSIGLSVSAAGQYGAFLTFLSGIESSQRLLDVSDITITGSNTSTYTYHLTIRIYWLR